jgi:hypothetical protein
MLTTYLSSLRITRSIRLRALRQGFLATIPPEDHPAWSRSRFLRDLGAAGWVVTADNHGTAIVIPPTRQQPVGAHLRPAAAV